MLNQRGDTIVEVAVAFAVFMLLSMGSMILMNQGTAIAQRSLDQTQVRQVINGQADILRLARQDSTIWSTIKSNIVTTSSDILTAADLSTNCPTASPSKSFIVTKNAGATALQYVALNGATNFGAAPVTSYVDYTASKAWGLWVQAVKINGTPAAYDMYIRACWDSVGGKVPMTMATIVRLYDTAN